MPINKLTWTKFMHQIFIIIILLINLQENITRIWFIAT